MQANPVRIGMVFGSLLALFHAGWAALVAAGIAQPILDFVFWAHFIDPPYRVVSFDWSRTVVLIGLTFAVGLISGLVGGFLWNRFARSDHSSLAV
jgi:hypothetical protein